MLIINYVIYVFTLRLYNVYQINNIFYTDKVSKCSSDTLCVASIHEAFSKSLI